MSSSKNLMTVSLFVGLLFQACTSSANKEYRDRISINDNWKYMKYESIGEADDLIYDVRPEGIEYNDAQQADTRPEESAIIKAADREVLKPWIMPTGNDFIKDTSKHYKRPDGNPGSDFPFVQNNFDDNEWENVTLPHDWAIKGPFFEGDDVLVTGGMGRLPSPGVAWYRRNLDISESDEGKSVFLDIDGAMSYSMVWLNGNLVGGWPFGYASWRLDLTPYLKFGGENQLAIRLDNPLESSRWYPGGGLYRNVWLVKASPVHIGQWGTFITTPQVSESSATVHLDVTIDNDSETDANVWVTTVFFELDSKGKKVGGEVGDIETENISVLAGKSTTISQSVIITNPRLWGAPPTQAPNRYIAKTMVFQNGELIDNYDTKFGIRTIELDPERGVIVNGEHITIKGANQHHDLGALGGAFNTRAAERQLEILAEAGTNSIRMAHNPPAPELLNLTDKMGFLVIDESFDVWERRKAPLDFHLIFPEWHEQDLRALVRRDRNHPSVILWSTGNEVGEQYTGQAGADLSSALTQIVKEEDPTRLTTVSMNFAKPPMEFPEPIEVISLNYQGEGIRNDGAYAHLRTRGITTPPLYPSFKETYPNKVIVSSENAAAVSSRGTYLFPIVEGISSPISPGVGGDPETGYVSAYEMYTTDFGSSADKVFRSLDEHPYVAGGFVWSGWDYLGEPTPYYSSRSSYFGFIDLAGFKKDRFYLYQAYWRPDYPMAHIFPHWNWPDRIGEVTPVHVATSGDEAELFLNGESLGRKRKGEFEYRLRWDDVVYEPGELKVIAYKNGEQWAEDVVVTTGEPARLQLEADRSEITADGKDLSFITLKVVDENGNTVPTAMNSIQFSIEGPGEIVATDNGAQMDFTPFPSHERNVFNGLALAIVKGIKGEPGEIKVTAKSDGLKRALVVVKTIE
tara:strand:- start:2635 stop:5373 length:2739 start_codon:yes stop_codon:yes gene_type:complete